MRVSVRTESSDERGRARKSEQQSLERGAHRIQAD
jgi:hypothetical protein